MIAALVLLLGIHANADWSNDAETSRAPAQRGSRQQQPQQKEAPAYRQQEDLDEQMRALIGRIDVVENQLVQLNAAHAGEKDNKEKAAVDQKFLVFEDALKKLEAQIHTVSDDVAKMKVAMEEQAKKPAVTEKPEKKEGKNPNKFFDDGENLFKEKKYKEAILALQKYRDANPKGKNYSEATYKMGVCFQELGMKDDAKVFFDEVVSKFPGSKDAKKAAFRAKQLK